jgi:hypothetical protein
VPEAHAPTRRINTSAEVTTEPRRSSWLHTPTKRYGEEVLLLDNDEPAIYKEASDGPWLY